MLALVPLFAIAGCSSDNGRELALFYHWSAAGDAEPAPAPIKVPRMTVPADPASLNVPDAVFWAWALLDRTNGQIAGSANASTGTNTTESMIKVWIVADYLRRLAEQGKEPTPTALNELTLAIIDSNDIMAQKYYVAGGGDAVVRRLIDICGLENTRITSGWWSKTMMPPMDAVRYGLCVAEGKAAGPRWTNWVLETMTHVRGSVKDNTASVTVQGGRWGIIDALPGALRKTTAIKNGWTAYYDGTGAWHVNCLAINKYWILAVEIRTNKNLASAADGCATIAKALLTPPEVV